MFAGKLYRVCCYRRRGNNNYRIYQEIKGCTFNCAFCYNKIFNRGRWRAWSVDAVVEDIDFLKKNYGVNAIQFYDDNFFINQQRALEILERVALPSHVEIRIDMITDDLAQKLKKLKVEKLLIGIESGSNRMLKLIK